MGSGATGVIYEAVRISDGLPVAIKLLRAAAAHEAVASDRLRREAEALGLAWHPNVVEVIDQGHLPDGTAYLVMELLHGESLAARVQALGHIGPRDLLPIAMQVCDALAAIHAAGIVHRDLKPSNIFLARDAEGGRRARQAPRLRDRARRMGRDSDHQHGGAARHTRIHVARARGRSRRRRCAKRHLLVGGAPLRMPRR